MRPEYLVTKSSDNSITTIHRVIGDTEKYWKCLLGEGEQFLVNKTTLRRLGDYNLRYYSMTKSEVESYREKKKLIDRINTKFKKINLNNLSYEDLSKILGVLYEV